MVSASQALWQTPVIPALGKKAEGSKDTSLHEPEGRRSARCRNAVGKLKSAKAGFRDGQVLLREEMP